MGLTIRPHGLAVAQLRAANIPEDYWECDFTNYTGSPAAMEHTVGYLQKLNHHHNRGVGLLYVGDHGTGKTTLAMIAMKYIARARWDVYCTSLGELVETIQRSWKDETQSDVILRAREAAYLFIDDLGKEHRGGTGFVTRVFDNLIRSRVQHRNPTFITSNLTKGEIEQLYGESTLSLFEGKLIPITVNGTDYRRTVQKKEIRG